MERPMKQCSECGAHVSVGNQVCPDCGEDLRISRVPPWLCWILFLAWLLIGGSLHLPLKVAVPLGIVVLLAHELWVYRMERVTMKPTPPEKSHLT